MKSLTSWLLVGVLVGLPSVARAAEASGFGIVKGTITIAGKPAPDTVVSIEGLSKEQIKTQMSHTKPQKKIIDQRNLKFLPTVAAITVGETVDFPNNDKSWHNVYSKAARTISISASTPQVRLEARNSTRLAFHAFCVTPTRIWKPSWS